MTLLEKIQSRKFLMALVAILYFAWTGGGPEQSFPAITQVVLGYLAVTAAQDAIADWQTARNPAAPPPAASVPPGPEVTDGPDEGDIAWTGSVI